MAIRKTTDSALADVLQLETVTTDCYRQVRDQLREVVIRLGAKGTLRLPSEAELSTALGVSRATLRSALQALQQEGRIRRLHGRGTFINRYALGVGANLAEAGAFVDLLGRAGHEPSVRIVDQRVVELGADDATALELTAGTPALQIERVFDAGGEPAVHSVDLVPAALLGENPEQRDAGRSTFEFVETHLGPPVCYSVAEVRPVLPSPALVQTLHIPATQPLLRLRHTHIRDDEQPVAVTVAHINDEYLRFSVIRTYLDE
ncbi:GntR family transcriptional regulator [Pseudonocardia xinjiangensis]|uniref:GntR family transcriptional regulator n=1 Tax=Pseudonocardia xinjiangensis TaxID=75289 RepID=A0ABX1R7K2_9PSEU|nr:GntR family transcriptional regulator [Pseudonocardia xinjiangensis]NMH76027.1 GntR family transcriptional regulator [Pseudonocardia xinjiangensis]